MPSNLKRAIAREGLIIISLACFSLTLYFLAIGLYSIKFKSTYELKFRNGEIHKVKLTTSVKESKSDSTIPSSEEWGEIVEGAFQTTPDNILENKLISRNLPFSLFPFIKNVAPIMEMAGILFFSITYPIYLLIRFIIWAIKTLKQKND